MSFPFPINYCVPILATTASTPLQRAEKLRNAVLFLNCPSTQKPKLHNRGTQSIVPTSTTNPTNPTRVRCFYFSLLHEITNRDRSWISTRETHWSTSANRLKQTRHEYMPRPYSIHSRESWVQDHLRNLGCFRLDLVFLEYILVGHKTDEVL